MDASAAKLIGAGLATIALAGVGIGIGNIFGSFVSGALRNPEAAPRVFGNVLLGFALTEAVLMLACIIQRAELSPVADARIEPYAMITLRPKHGMPLNVKAKR